jgi:hypothetical protein
MTDISKDEEVIKAIREFYEKNGTGTNKSLTKYFEKAEEYAYLNEKYTKEELEPIAKKIRVM